MKILEPMNWQALKHEYGLDGKRLLPWQGVTLPFGGAYCVVRAGTESLAHVNQPLGEEELFVCVQGSAHVIVGEEELPVKMGDVIYIPAGRNHYIRAGAEDFHLYSVWWSRETCEGYLAVQGEALA